MEKSDSERCSFFTINHTMSYINPVNQSAEYYAIILNIGYPIFAGEREVIVEKSEWNRSCSSIQGQRK